MTQSIKLPQKLADDLLLRWAMPDDADELAEFNKQIHSDNPEEPEQFLADWTRDLMDGSHPTTKASDFTVVEDRMTGKIVSSLNLISQVWEMDGVRFGVGRPELVGTDPDYRRRGLVRAQMDAVHALSAARGEWVQAITGIPWYYRLFGYEMALDLGGSRQLFWDRPGVHKPVDEELYQMRRTELADMPVLKELYAEHGRANLINRVRDDELWTYELTQLNSESPSYRNMHIIEQDGDAVAYVEFRQWGTSFTMREIGVKPGHSWRAVGQFVSRMLKKEADELNKKREKPIRYLSFSLGQAHPMYEAMERLLERQIPPYAWYVRVSDLPGFLRHLTPVWERRLANSVMAGHSGTVRLNFYHSHLTLEFGGGRLTEIGTYEPKFVQDGDALFPDLTFLQLMFGRRSVAELADAFGDCYVQNGDAWVLLPILFPKRPSHVIGLV